MRHGTDRTRAHKVGTLAAEGWEAGQRVKRMEGFFWTRNCFKFAALFVGAERTEVHGTDFRGLCLGTWHRHP